MQHVWPSPHAAHGHVLQAGEAKYRSHMPAMVHTSSALHTFPHAPQFAGSPFRKAVETHFPPPQSV
jgi:hypothetical protein